MNCRISLFPSRAIRMLLVPATVFILGCNDHAELDASKYLADADTATSASSEVSSQETDSTTSSESKDTTPTATVSATAESPTKVESPSEADSGKAKSDDRTATVSSAKPTAPPQKLQASALDVEGIQVKRRSDGQVAEVHIRDVAATDAMAEEISTMGKLVKLTIYQSDLSDAGWKQFSQLGELQHLDLRGCAVNNDQLVSAVAGMPKLRALRLNGKSGDTTVDDLGMKVLAQCPELKALALDHLWVGSDGLQHLVNNKKLSELYMAGTLVEDDAMEYVAQLPALKKLRVALTSVSEVGLERVADLPLEDLDVSECSQLYDEAMKTIGKMQGLKRLNLFKVVVSDLGVEELQGLTKLEWLNLDQTQLTDEGLPYLKPMTKMKFLHLGSTGVSDEGMKNLFAMKDLKDLIVTRTAVTEAGVKAVQSALPSVSVQLKYVEGE